MRPIALPECRHAFPRVIRKVKKEGLNKDRVFFCCGQEDTCKYFEWVSEEPYNDANFLKPFAAKHDEKHEKQ